MGLLLGTIEPLDSAKFRSNLFERQSCGDRIGVIENKNILDRFFVVNELFRSPLRK